MKIWREILIEHVSNEDMPDLSIRQWAVLVTIYHDDGPHTVRKLSHDLNIPKPAISRALDSLSILNLIKRARDPADRRIVLLRRTNEGDIFIKKFEELLDNKYAHINKVA